MPGWQQWKGLALLTIDGVEGLDLQRIAISGSIEQYNHFGKVCHYHSWQYAYPVTSNSAPRRVASYRKTCLCALGCTVKNSPSGTYSSQESTREACKYLPEDEYLNTFQCIKTTDHFIAVKINRLQLCVAIWTNFRS